MILWFDTFSTPGYVFSTILVQLTSTCKLVSEFIMFDCTENLYAKR